MQNLSLLENNSQPFILDNSLFFNFNDHSKANLDIFHSTTKSKSYITITSCVFDHIFKVPALTNHEKFYYLLADSLALVCKNKNGYRSCALSSKEWAKRLGCSRSLVFALQQSLVKKGYFIINKTQDKIGRNKRNLIIPTLPVSIFNNLNEESPDIIGEHIPYNPLTECKRTYLDRTKLFIKLNYNLLKIITSNKLLNPRQKVMWLSFYVRCYKNYMLQNGSNFAFIASYSELANLYSCTIKHLSKSIGVLKELDFIKIKHFYIREKHSDNKDSFCKDIDNNLNEIQERQNQSLWKITLSLPNDCILELEKVKNRSNFKLNDSTAISNDSTVDSFEDCLTLGGIKFNLNLEQVTLLKSIIIDDVGSSNINCDGDTTIITPLPDFSNASSYIDSVMEELDESNNENRKGNTKSKLEESGLSEADFLPNSSKSLPDLSFPEISDNIEEKNNGIKSDPTFAKSRLLLSKEIKIKKEDRYLDKSNFYKNPLSSNSIKVEVTKSAPIPNKQLKDFYPLNETDCKKLNILSGRNFTLRAMNEILLDMSNKLKDRWFKGKKSFLNYVSLAFRYEKRMEELINRESYRIRNNYTNEENNIKEQEEYLTKIEYSREVSPEWHFKKRLAAVFTRDKAYKLLTSYIRIEIDNGVFKLYLSKSLELSKFDYEILLNQAKSTHETLCSESLEYKEITKFEIIKPIINSENKHSNNKIEVYEGLWGSVRKQLIKYFGSNGEGLDKSWFSKLSADIDENNKIVKLKAPTNFIKDWIYQNYFHRIESFFNDESYECQLLTN